MFFRYCLDFRCLLIVDYIWIKISFSIRFSRYNHISSCFNEMNGDGEIRTLDPLLARQVLSQLSYTPTFSGLKWTRTIDLTLIRRAL